MESGEYELSTLDLARAPLLVWLLGKLRTDETETTMETTEISTSTQHPECCSSPHPDPGSGRAFSPPLVSHGVTSKLLAAGFFFELQLYHALDHRFCWPCHPGPGTPHPITITPILILEALAKRWCAASQNRRRGCRSRVSRGLTQSRDNEDARSGRGRTRTKGLEEKTTLQIQQTLLPTCSFR